MDYQLICDECGEKFVARNKSGKLCPSCKYEKAMKQHAKYVKGIRRTKAKQG